MKIRRHILKRYEDHIKAGRILGTANKDDDGHFRYSFNGKIVLVVNALEHEHLKKQYPGHFREGTL